MKKLLLLSSVIAGLILCACDGKEDLMTESPQLVKGINVSIEDANFELFPSTRSSYVVDPTRGFISSWEEGDTIGIYPIGGDQVAFPISEGEGTKNAKFDGGAWALRSSFQYAAYYPFNKKNYYKSEKEIPVTYIGQKQTANNSTTHLAPYDYLAAAATSPTSEGNVNLAMKRLGCFVRIQIPIKVTGTFKELQLSTSEASFITEGIVDLQAATPSIATKTTAAVLSIALDNIVVENGETLTIYAMLAPVDLSDKTITIVLKNTTNNYYYYTIAGKNMVAGKAYNYSISNVPNANGHDYVDLGLPSGTLWATMNIGANAPEEVGHYYFWGDIIPVEETSWEYRKLPLNYKHFTYSNYSSYDGNYTINKYSPQDGKAFLDEEDDVAHVEWGGSWRMPTITERDELINHCTTEVITMGSMKVAKVTGPNGNYILLPFGGYITYPPDGTWDTTTKKYKFTPTHTSTDSYPYGGYWTNQIHPGYVNTSSTGYTASSCLRLDTYNPSLTEDTWIRNGYCLNVRAVL